MVWKSIVSNYWKSKEEGEIKEKMQGGGQIKCWEQRDIDEKVRVSILAIKMLAKATAIFIAMAVQWVCRQLLRQNWNDYCVNIEYFRYLVGIRAFRSEVVSPSRGMLVYGEVTHLLAQRELELNIVVLYFLPSLSQKNLTAKTKRTLDAITGLLHD